MLQPRTKTWQEVVPGAPEWLLNRPFLGGSVPGSWMQPPGPQPAIAPPPGAGYAAAAAGTAAATTPQFIPATYTGYTDFGSFTPSEFYGLSEPGLYGQLQQSLFDEQMAMVSADLGRRGVLSSSMTGAASVAAADAAMRQRLQLEMQENALRTQWGQQEAQRETQFGLQRGQLMAQQAGRETAFSEAEAARQTRFQQEQQLQAWREQEAQAERAHAMQMLVKQINAQREAQKLADMQQFRQFFGSLGVEDSFRLMDALADSAPGPSVGDYGLAANPYGGAAMAPAGIGGGMSQAWPNSYAPYTGTMNAMPMSPTVSWEDYVSGQGY